MVYNKINNNYYCKIYYYYYYSPLVLPNSPIVDIDTLSKTINFHSPRSNGIPLDYFQIIITDIANTLTVYNKSISSELNNITIPNFPLSCSIYNVVVQAHNLFGFTEFSTKLGNNTEGKYLSSTILHLSVCVCACVCIDCRGEEKDRKRHFFNLHPPCPNPCIVEA